MTPHVFHQCLCGYCAPNYTQFRKHRLKCLEWRGRPNPRGLSRWRREQTLAKKKKGIVQSVRPVAPPTVEELAGDERFSSFLRRTGMNLQAFAAFLKVLATYRQNPPR